MSVLGSFNDETFQDFTRCMRPNGTFYGTRGKCKSESESGAKEEAPRRPKAVVEADGRAIIQKMKGAKGLELIRLKAQLQETKAQLRKSNPTVVAKCKLKREADKLTKGS
jgi:hypothetical protein